jgi:hypothetical protein
MGAGTFWNIALIMSHEGEAVCMGLCVIGDYMRSVRRKLTNVHRIFLTFRLTSDQGKIFLTTWPTK